MPAWSSRSNGRVRAPLVDVFGDRVVTAAAAQPPVAGSTDPATRRALFAALRQSPADAERELLRSLDDDGWARLLDAARRQRVAGLVRHRLRHLGVDGLIPAPVAAGFEATTRRAGLRVMALHAELAVILERFASLDLPVILLKGAHLASVVYGDLALRDMGDLDLLVPVDRLEQAATVVQTLGYSPMRPSSVEIDREVGQHLTRAVKRGAGAVELHWNVTGPGHAHSIDPAGLWRRAVPVRVAGRDVRALSVEDEILHLCVHTSYGHLFGFGLRSLCDISMLAGPGAPIDWRALADRAVEWHWERGVFLTLLLARDRLGVAAPADTLDRLEPRAFDASLAALAEAQLFADPADVRKLGGGISRLARPQSLASRLKLVRDRVFLEPARLAYLSSRPLGIPRRERILWYPVRFWDLVRRYGPTTVRLWRERGSPFTHTAERQDRLRTWLLGG
jgi:hypothetical protein